MPLFLRSLQLRGLLSFGPDAEALQLEPLNILIGPNACGKSNLIEAINILRATAGDLAAPIREGGGIGEFFWKGNPPAKGAWINAEIEHSPVGLCHEIEFHEVAQRFELTRENIETCYRPEERHFHYTREYGESWVNETGLESRRIVSEEPDESALTRFRDPDRTPELAFLGNWYRRVRLYREWHFGRSTPPRRPQQADLPNDFLLEDASNLSLILNQLEFKGQREPLIKFLKAIHPGFEDLTTKIDGGTVQVYFREKNLRRPIPATRLSDGTIRFLCLAAVLLHPNPPPLICLEEPEISLHPDVLKDFADLLVDAATRTQIILTTHSVELVDAFTHRPSAVVVVEKENGSTRFRRLSEEDTRPWPDQSLGQLWQRGQFGGNRW